MWDFGQNFQWWMPFFGMGMMLFWPVVIGLLVWGLIRLTTSKTQHLDTGESPIEILKKRLARGEITVEQFEELQESLQESRRTADMVLRK